MDKINILAIFVVVTFALALVNIYSFIGINNKLDAITGKITEIRQPEQPEAFPKVQVSADDDSRIGPQNAAVTIIEFSDYQCIYCERAEATIKQIISNYGNDVKFVYRDFPLSFHQFAQKAAEASECADEQGKFWQYHDKLFDNQQALNTSDLKQYAKEIGMDSVKFNECLDNSRMASEVQKDIEDGQSYGVSGTPTFFINGIELVGAQPYSAFEQLINQELNK